MQRRCQQISFIPFKLACTFRECRKFKLYLDGP